MRVRLLSGKGVLYDGDALSCLIPAEKGPTYFGESTTRMIVLLNSAGVLQVNKANAKTFFAVFGGVASMEGGILTIASPLIEEGSSIDAARAKESKERAEKRLMEKDEEIDLARAKASLNRALTRLSAKHLASGGNA